MWAERADRGLVRTTTLTRLELGYSARTATDWRAELDVAPLAAMPIQYLTVRLNPVRTGRLPG